MSVVDPVRDERGWRFDAGDAARPGQRLRASSARPTSRTDPALRRPRHGARALGHARPAGSSTTSRAEIVRMLNAVRRSPTTPLDLYPEDAARRDRRAQRPRLPQRQQRRLPRRLRHHAGRPTREAFDELFATLDWLEERLATQPLPARRRASPRPTGGSSRRSSASTPSTTATSSATCAASPTTRTCRAYAARPLPAARHRRDGRLRPHQAPLLHDPAADQPDADRAQRARARPAARRTGASGCAAVTRPDAAPNARPEPWPSGGVCDGGDTK